MSTTHPDPFPDRITSGCPATAARLHHHAEATARDLERAERILDGISPDDAPTARQRDAARRYRRAARERRALDALATLHERFHAPSPLFTLRTRRHVRAVLTSTTYTDVAASTLRRALRWTLGLPMPRALGFAIMREGFDRLGLLDPVPLPLHVRAVLPSEKPPLPVHAGDSLPASPVVVSVARPATVEAFAEAARDHALTLGPAWIAHVTAFPGIDYADPFEIGLSVAEAATLARDWIVGCVVFGPRPLDWRRAPFVRDESDRLCTAGEGRGGPIPAEP